MPHAINARKFAKWRDSTLRQIMAFSPGYGQEYDFDSKGEWSGGDLSAEEALYVFECMGLNSHAPCREKEKFGELLQRKDNMNLSIASWKREINDILSGSFWFAPWRWKFVQVFEVAERLKEDFPDDFLRKIGILQIVDETEKKAVEEFLLELATNSATHTTGGGCYE